jgi:hypothetical protein
MRFEVWECHGCREMTKGGACSCEDGEPRVIDSYDAEDAAKDFGDWADAQEQSDERDVFVRDPEGKVTRFRVTSEPSLMYYAKAVP